MRFIWSCIFCLGFLATQAQSYNEKYGKITDEELNMTVCPLDSTAEAYVIQHLGEMKYEYSSDDGFQIVLNCTYRIKILKESGLSRANIEIPYYVYKDSKERVNKIEACAYNLKNNKIVETKLTKEYIFDEIINKNERVIKFTIPGAKVGSIIEYKYRFYLPYSTNIPDWVMQQDIPVCFSRLKFQVPEYFHLTALTKGFVPIHRTDEEAGCHFHIHNVRLVLSEDVYCNSLKATFAARDLPAMPRENYLWNSKDFKTMVRFEVSGTKFPGSEFKPFTKEWKDVDNLLKKDDDFGPLLSMKNPYQYQVSAIKAEKTDSIEKIRAILRLLQSKMEWDQKYRCFAPEIKKAIEKSSGSSADINFVLISALKDAGFNCYPVLLSHRSAGRLLKNLPGIYTLTSFVVAVELGKNKMVYLDGTSKYSDVNVLSDEFLVDLGRVYGCPDKEWVDLSSLGSNTKRISIVASIQNDSLVGIVRADYLNQQAMDHHLFKGTFRDSLEYCEKIESTNKIKLISAKPAVEVNGAIKEEFKFFRPLSSTDKLIYLDPMIISHMTENPFTKSERVFPVEFDYPQSIKISTAIKIPENYHVKDLPKSESVAFENNDIKMSYLIGLNQDKLTLLYTYELKRRIYDVKEYPGLRDFFAKLASKNIQPVVLKRIDL